MISCLMSQFLFASLHFNAGAHLRGEINLISLTLQPFHFHTHEGNDLHVDHGVNPPNNAYVKSIFKESCGSFIN
jgi:hypothetical protein